MMDIAIVGIDTEHISPMFDFEGHVLVQQLQRTDANRKQDQTLEKFEGRD
jgi:hypothetical protein